jgi:serine/threonine protein kinase
VLSVQRNGQEPWLLQPRFNALNSPRLPAPQALWMARTMASALEALHTAGWLHTSLTAESAVWGLSGAIVLSDVGWCRRRGTEECLAEHAALVGDIHYTPPELFHGPTHLTPAADMYRLGVALCHWLTGASPWKNTWASELVAIKCTRSVSTYLPTALSYGVRSLLEKLLNRNPLRRPTAGEVMQTLVALEIDTFSQWDTAAAA